MDAEFAHHAKLVILDCAFSQLHEACTLFDGLTLGKQQHDFHFAIRKLRNNWLIGFSSALRLNQSITNARCHSATFQQAFREYLRPHQKEPPENNTRQES